MRDIKFRAWDKKDNQMIENVCVFTHAVGTSVMVNFGHKQLPYAPGDNWRADHYGNRYSDDGSVIPMQYTGLKDKNDVEIYEGEILHFMEFYNGGGMEGYREAERETTDKVYWDDEAAGWSIDSLPLTIPTQDDECEVIGNIYENRDLLK